MVSRLESLIEDLRGFLSGNYVLRIAYGTAIATTVAAMLACGDDKKHTPPISTPTPISIEQPAPPNPDYNLSVILPKEDDKWPIGSTQTVEITSVGFPESQLVDIALGRSNQLIHDLKKEMLIKDSPYSVNVPDVQTGNSYYVQVGTSIDGKFISGRSGSFNIVPKPVQTPTPPAIPEPVTGVLVGAGDIAVCGSRGTEETARLLDRSPGTIFTVGDHVYPFASAQNFQQCYEPTWGRHKLRTRTSPGNHDWDEADNGISYFAYFGASAGPSGLGYYSFNVGDAHVISLNSNLRGGEMSAQVSWLQGDLAAHSNYACTISILHHPLVSSGTNGDNWHVRDMERALYEANADAVINGHDHDYERFAPQDPQGILDLKRGLVRLIAGTGGAPLYSFVTVKPNSEVRYSGWGVLELTIYKTKIEHKFIKISGEEFDKGTITCH